MSDRSLILSYGLDIVAGISAQLYGNGARADIVLEDTLMLAVRDATLTAFQHNLAAFATTSQLHADGQNEFHRLKGPDR